MSKQLLLDWLVYFAVRVVVSLVGALRIETCETLARMLAWFANDLLQVRSRVVDENLSFVFPELSADQRRRLGRQMWEHLFLMGAEIVHAPRKIHRTNWYRFVHIEHPQQFLRYMLDPRPTLIVSGHFGNFELGGYVFGLLGFPTFTVARKLDNPFLDRWINRFRGANGQYIVSNQGSALQIDQVLAGGAALMSLGDQHAGPKGCWVDFFGRPASCHKALALFTLTSGAPMLVAYCRRNGRPMRFVNAVEGTADPRSLPAELSGVVPLTQWYNELLERIVRAAPDQYWWLHRRWKAAPTRRRAAGGKAAA